MAKSTRKKGWTEEDYDDDGKMDSLNSRLADDYDDDDEDDDDYEEEEDERGGHGGLIALLIILIIVAALGAQVAVYTRYTGTNPLSGVPVIGQLFDRALKPGNGASETATVPAVVEATTEEPRTAAPTTVRETMTAEATTEEPETETTTEEETTEAATAETTEAAAAASEPVNSQIVSDGNTTPQAILTVVTDSLNVRADANTSGDPIGTLYSGEERYVYQTTNDGTYNWYRVKEGWVADNGSFVQMRPVE